MWRMPKTGIVPGWVPAKAAASASTVALLGGTITCAAGLIAWVVSTGPSNVRFEAAEQSFPAVPVGVPHLLELVLTNPTGHAATIIGHVEC